MTDLLAKTAMPRRHFLGGVVASAGLLLPGCKAIADAVTTNVVRNLMTESSDRAIDKLMSPGGGWDRYIQAELLQPDVGLRGQMLANALESDRVKTGVTKEFREIAHDVTDATAPVIADTIRKIGIRNVKEIVDGGPTAATDYLRTVMGNAISNSIVGDIARYMGSDQAREIATIARNVDPQEVKATARRFADRVQEVILDQIAIAEAEIRANPEITGDPELIAVFGKNKSS